MIYQAIQTFYILGWYHKWFCSHQQNTPLFQLLYQTEHFFANIKKISVSCNVCEEKNSWLLSTVSKHTFSRKIWLHLRDHTLMLLIKRNKLKIVCVISSIIKMYITEWFRFHIFKFYLPKNQTELPSLSKT